MPIMKDEEFGTNADHSKNKDYCFYCFQEGAFTQDLSMDEMISHNLEYLDEYNKDAEVKVSPEEAREQMKEFFPQLRRWSQAGQ